MIETWEVVALLICFLLSGFFAASEAALMSLGVDRAKRIMEKGGKKTVAMTFMLERPNELLATILVGNNIFNILAASLTTEFAGRIFQSNTVAISTGITTFIILIFGEIIPKVFARAHAENLSIFIIYILRLKYYVMYPIIRAMVWIIKTVLGETAELKGGVCY